MKNLPEGSPSVDAGGLDPSGLEETRLGGHLEQHLVPEDPDDRQYWLWDVDPLQTEKCEDESAN